MAVKLAQARVPTSVVVRLSLPQGDRGGWIWERWNGLIVGEDAPEGITSMLGAGLRVHEMHPRPGCTPLSPRLTA